MLYNHLARASVKISVGMAGNAIDNPLCSYRRLSIQSIAAVLRKQPNPPFAPLVTLEHV
jgi:hypothetical protein